MSNTECGVSSPKAMRARFALALGEGTDGLVQERFEVELLDDFRAD